MKKLLESIIPAQTLGMEIVNWNGRCVELAAPLSKNLNDKGTAFAGSIDALLDLAGWSAITLALRNAGIDADVMIVKSETEYTAAVRVDMVSSAEIPVDDWPRVLQEMKTRGRSRVMLEARLFSDSTECASMTAHYAVIAHQTYHLNSRP